MSRRKSNYNYVTIRDVAEFAETSIATVSYVLNDSKDRYISDELRDRVLNAASELNYIKSGLASSLKGKQRGIIAVLTPQYSNPFFMNIFIAIEKIANQYGYVLSTCNTFDDADHEKEVLERMLTIRADGYLVIPTAKGAENMSRLIDYNIPFVVIERPLLGLTDYNYISSDNYEVGYKITKHLLEKGHKKIALIYWDTEVTNVYGRVTGYRAALEEAGIPFNQNYIKSGPFTNQMGKQLTRELLDDGKVTAIIYGQYMLAEDGIRYLHQEKIRIPEEISVAMVGDPVWAHMGEVEITRVAQAGTKMGEEAAKILLHKISGKADSGDYVQKIIPSELFIGNSVKDIKTDR